MVQPLSTLTETASQTAGPYVHIGCMPNHAGIGGVYPEDLGGSPVADGAEGERITIRGHVYDGTGWAMRDALIESWQADARGLFAGQEGADPAVTGFARVACNADSGEWRLDTIKPGPVRDASGRAWAPHIALWIVARGINIGLQTRIYFAGDDHAEDPLLARVEQRARVDTLIAKPDGAGAWRFDIRLRGAGETVFLDL